jgi:protein-disulfide isomerase
LQPRVATTTTLPFRPMPSGKKSKQMRRAASAPPPVQSKGGPRRGRQANPKVLAIVGAVVVLAAIGIGLALALGGGSKTSNYPAIGTLTNSLPGASDVQTLFKGIPQNGLTLGNPKAPVTMIEYIDLQCPFCQQFETQVMPGIINKYVRTGKVKIEARILDFIGPDSSRGRKAMIAAATQNRAYNFSEILYYNQGTENTGWLNDAMVGQAVSSIPGVRVHEILNLVSSSSVSKQAAAFDVQKTADKVLGTPTLFAGKTGTKGKQIPLRSPTDSQSVVTSLDAALAS